MCVEQADGVSTSRLPHEPRELCDNDLYPSRSVSPMRLSEMRDLQNSLATLAMKDTGSKDLEHATRNSLAGLPATAAPETDLDRAVQELEDHQTAQALQQTLDSDRLDGKSWPPI